MGSIVRLSRVVTTQPRNVLQHKTGSGGHPGHGHLCCSSAPSRSQPSHLPKLSFLWTFSSRSSCCCPPGTWSCCPCCCRACCHCSAKFHRLGWTFWKHWSFRPLWSFRMHPVLII